MRAAYYFFLVCGVGGLGYSAYVVADAHAYQAIEMSKFSHALPSSERRVLAEGDLVGELDIPRLKLNAIVVQGESPRVLRHAVGHLAQTPLPGEPGNIALAGHRDSFFRSLRAIEPGDAVTIKTLDGLFRYQVESTEIVGPGDVRVLGADRGNTLTLVTCFPFYYIGPAPKRFIVRARQTEPLPEESTPPGASPHR